MKVLIWVHKDEVINGKIIEYYSHLPLGGYMDYVQVVITQDEFVRLEDKD
jgi:hypothetical protein|tara:strand:+ start:1258 stop:1407 length:150 start_codon:yes stop_codon:yes gene_type:complete